VACRGRRPGRRRCRWACSAGILLRARELSPQAPVSSVMRPKHVVRALLQRPGFTAIALVTIAIGIGANTAVFSVVERSLLKPLPYPQPDALVALDHAAPGVNIESAGSAPFLYFTYRDHGQAFQDVGLWRSDTMSVTGLAQPEEVPSLHVSDGVLPM